MASLMERLAGVRPSHTFSVLFGDATCVSNDNDPLGKALAHLLQETDTRCQFSFTVTQTSAECIAVTMTIVRLGLNVVTHVFGGPVLSQHTLRCGLTAVIDGFDSMNPCYR